MILQRIRFCRLEREEPGPGAESDLWRRRGEAVYAIPQGNAVSYDTFFNAFFLATWRRLAPLKTLSLRLEIEGAALIEIFAHNERGERESLAAVSFPGGTFSFDFGEELTRTLRLSFTLTGGRLLGGAWTTRDEAPAPVRLAIVFPTFGRTQYAQRLIDHILADEALRQESVDLWVTDQNETAELDPIDPARCHILRQPNLGCSGGVARALYEAEATAPTHYLILDDDIFLESDSILRALRLMQFAQQPIVLGGVMLDLLQPNLVQGIGDALTTTDKDFREVDPHLPALAVDLPHALDAAQIPFRSDFAAWWFCMFPAELVRRIGLPAPFFVRWDDIEYSTRARAAGYAVHVPPGIGVWHQPFGTKTAPWLMQLNSYSLLVYHAVHEPAAFQPFLTHLIGEVKTMLSRHQYRRACCILAAMEDALDGWNHFSTRAFPGYLKTVNETLERYESNEGEAPRIDEDQALSLARRLEAVSHADAARSREELAAGLPLSYSRAAWEHYFKHGSLAGFSP